MASNRFIDRDNPKETSRVDLNTTLLDIMQKEFPNDPLYSQGYLTPKQITQLSTYVKPFNEKEVTVAMRDSYNVLQMSSGSKTYAEYTLDKSYPTINDDDLDDFIEDGWDFYVKSDLPRPIPPTGLFLINNEIELNPVDWHDAYLQYGPTTITARLVDGRRLDGREPESVIRSTFCVYYVENGRALPIPNYQTLEVMLVERGKTYSDIQEATPEQIQEFDMVLDGTFEGDRTLGKPDPLEEFEFRKVLDRSNDWNYQVRFESGYRPKAPFFRDPGDYLKPAGYVGTGASDIYLAEDPRDLYFDQVFQKQTYREKLRVKYEGKMVILDWPVPYNDALVNSGTTDVQGDDLIFGLRMMINGFWKQVTDEDVARTYAALNNLSLSNYQIGQGRYSENGWLNLLVEAGGIEVLKNDGINSPIWNDFPHIVEADRLDIIEYRNYIDNYSNSGEPFNIEYLKPYEPEGSIAYYPPIRLRALQQQAAAQAEIDSIKADIQEHWPRLAARTISLSTIVNSQPADYTVLYRNKLGSPAAQPSQSDLSTPLYKILTADVPFRFKKRKNNGVIDERDTRLNLLEMFERNIKISGGAFSKPWDADNIFNLYQVGLVHSVATDERIGNIGYAKMPRRGDGDNSDRIARLLNDPGYIKRMIRASIISYNKGGASYWKDNKDYFDMDPLYTEAERVNKLLNDLRVDIQLAKDFVLEIDDLLFTADSLEAYQDIYNRMIALEDDLSAVSDQDLNDCNQCRIDIESVFKTFMEKLYNTVQFFRQRVLDEIGDDGKFYIEWPSSAILLMNIHLPGKTFDNYLPT
jgi:hypothetical protein